ncbi:MAG: glycosyltransferase [Thermoanaerobaculia bacterium]
MKLLILCAQVAGESTASRREARTRALLDAALGAGHRTLVVHPRKPQSWLACPPLPVAVELLSADPDALMSREFLDGVIADWAPDAILALGLSAALAVGQLGAGTPCAIDIDDGPWLPGFRPILPWGTDREIDFWHRLLWALDRADFVSCADSRTQDALAGMLAVRGNFAAYSADRSGSAATPCLIPNVASDGAARLDSQDSPDLCRWLEWLRQPAQRPRKARVMGFAEIADAVRAAGAAAQVAALERRGTVRFQTAVRRTAKAAMRKVRRGLGRLQEALTLPWLAMSTARLWLTGGRPPARPLAGGSDVEALERQLGRRPRLLLVMPYRIFPQRHGGAARLLGLLRNLSAKCDIYLLRFDQRGECRLERQELEKYCKRVEYHHWIVPPTERPAGVILPHYAWLFADERAAWRIRRLVASEQIDVVQLEYVEMAQYEAAAGEAPVILVEHDLAYRSTARKRRLDLAARFADARYHASTRRDLLRLLRYELRACRAADEIHFMSADDAGRMAQRLPSKSRIRVVPNAIETARFAPPDPPPSRAEALFIGNFENLPNRDALEWLLEEIWPRVRTLLPKASLTVIGARMPPELRARDGQNGVRIVGEVEDPIPAYHRHRALLVPLRAGSGTRLKILEAFAAGLPVVSTQLGAEGLEVEADRHLLVADDPTKFAAAVATLLGDPDLGERLAGEARRLVVAGYDAARSADLNYAAVLELAVARGALPVDAPLPSLPPGSAAVEISVILPTRSGGPLLERVLTAIAGQQTDRRREVVCIDSGSSPAELERMRALGARVIEIPPQSFNHGRTRDLGAAHSIGKVLVFLNQDALPADFQWLDRLTAPLFAAVPPAAVQGGIGEFPPGDASVPRGFFWNSGGPKFNFTRESAGWISRFGGIGFSTVNCAIRREVWQEIPFGRLAIMEDKLWQQTAVEREYRIVAVEEAAVLHTHGYDLRTLVSRSVAEGSGWRWIGERYRLRQALGDAFGRPVMREWWRALRHGRLRGASELFFPWLRSLALWWGNRGAIRALHRRRL